MTISARPLGRADAGYAQPAPNGNGQSVSRHRMNLEIVWNELK